MKDLSKIKLLPYTTLEFVAGVCAGASDDNTEVSVEVYHHKGEMRYRFKSEAIDQHMLVSIRKAQ